MNDSIERTLEQICAILDNADAPPDEVRAELIVDLLKAAGQTLPQGRAPELFARVNLLAEAKGIPLRLSFGGADNEPEEAA